MFLDQSFKFRAYKRIVRFTEAIVAAVLTVRSRKPLDNLSVESYGKFTKARVHTGNGEVFSIYHRGTHADLGVIGQIFVDQDYNISRFRQYNWVQTAYKKITANNQRPVIIDAGANIGIGSMYLKRMFPDSNLVAIEPSSSNLEVLRLNLNTNTDRIVHGAIHSGASTVDLRDPNEGEWGFSTHNAANRTANTLETVRCYKFSDLVESDEVPFILKVDIEGGEKGEFEDYTLLARFSLIIIELHDWLYPGDQTSASFLKFAATADFDFCHRGENIFLFNRTYMAD